MAHSIAGLIKWVEQADWQGPFGEALALHLGPACEAAGVTLAELPDLIDEEYSNNLWGCAFEDFLTWDMDDGGNLADDYLKRRGWKESAATKAYIAALRTSVMSLYEVSDIVRDQSFLARDLLRGGEPVKVNERSGTHFLKPWDRVAARIVEVRGRVQMAGGLLLFHHETSEALLDGFRREKKAAVRRARGSQRSGNAPPGRIPSADALADTDQLRESAMLFSNVWLEDALKRILNPQLPQVSNTDGEPIMFTTVTYPLSSPRRPDEIACVLNGLSFLQADGEMFWNWVGEQRVPPPKPSAKGPVSLITRLDDGSIALGAIELTDAALILQTNSRERATRAQALIEPALGEFVGAPTIKSQEVADIIASGAAGESKPAKRQSTLMPDEERALAHAYLDKYYAELLDQPVPVLGNVSPRRASKTDKGRAKLVAWLKQMENVAANGDADSAMASYDHGWLWQALGVSHLRR